MVLALAPERFKGGTMAVTISQIAKIAGVSRGTVDRAIHGRAGIDPDVKQNIHRIMEELNYKPNTVAIALKNNHKIKKIGIITVPSTQNPFYKEIETGIDAAVEFYLSHGCSVIKEYLYAFQPEEQLHCIETLLQQHIDGMILAPMDHVDIQSRINEAAQSIPIITYNTDLTGINRLCFIGHHHMAAGRTAGELMGKSLKKHGSIAVFIGTSKIAAHVERLQGFLEVMNERYPQYDILPTCETLDHDLIGYELTKELMEQQDHLIGIYASAAGQIGIAKALVESNQSHAVTMICFDLVPEIMRLVKDNVIDYTIGQDPFLQGYMPIKLMYEYLVLGINPTQSKYFTNIDIKLNESVMYQGFERFTGEPSEATCHL